MKVKERAHLLRFVFPKMKAFVFICVMINASVVLRACSCGGGAFNGDCLYNMEYHKWDGLY
jgi:hypothetical protein